ncbi:hypothetical protein [Kitasatospora sp. NPDC127060]|uniref:hypothetical protein n=1 Tax=Kitasatospora sp. NPDC127060 TaxID=3347121 RepID=UPI003657E2B2
MPARELPRVDWNGRTVETSPIERTLAAGRYKRVAGEIAEIRMAAQLMAEDADACRRETSAFLTVQARLLNGENEHATGADLPWGRDTKEVPDELPSPARSALLIARAYLAGR